MKLGHILAGASICALSIAGFAATASAQTTPPTTSPPTDEPDDPALLDTEVEAESGQAVNAGDEQAIVVTGSRIRRPNLGSTVPITSVGPEDIVETGQVSVGDQLNQLPQLRTTFSQANSTRFIGTAGQNFLDLRGLGTERTLVLVNNRRFVSTAPGSFRWDVNNVPADLVERVDIVTGGNSAIYGSDAVAGVVNFILRREFDGIQVRGQSGISDEGDSGSYFVSGIIGKMIDYTTKNSPLPEPLAAEDVGHAAAFLCSPLAAAITGSTVYVDKGYNVMGMGVDAIPPSDDAPA